MSERHLDAKELRYESFRSACKAAHHDCLALKGTGVRDAVGPNKAVYAELCIVDWIFKITAIAPCLHFVAVHILHLVQ